MNDVRAREACTKHVGEIRVLVDQEQILLPHSGLHERHCQSARTRAELDDARTRVHVGRHQLREPTAARRDSAYVERIAKPTARKHTTMRISFRT